jgi:hypothetical protein
MGPQPERASSRLQGNHVRVDFSSREQLSGPSRPTRKRPRPVTQRCHRAHVLSYGGWGEDAVKCRKGSRESTVRSEGAAVGLEVTTA